MKKARMLPSATPWLLVAAALTLGAGVVMADSAGRTGKAQSPNGCNCHGTTRTAGVTVTISGPQNVVVNSTNSYTVTLLGGPSATQGGFNLKASNGTLVAGANNRISGLEMTHVNEFSRSWTFSWKAPAVVGTSNFYAIGLSTDGSGDESGDQWNWYGGVVNTAFPIVVANAAGVEDEGALTWLAPPSPNPCVGRSVVSFSLAAPTHVRLELLDTAGRVVRTLTDASLPAGRQSVSWDRRSATGARAAAGVYFVRMSTPQRVLTTRVTVLD
ncbi:MAG: T9SS type A sorting domain-containing protein [Candidatus Eisenbacteria bacterium]|uniref:T9SS type A sorting domain-containing protein n=1 Tax=Eiseniibacteriota bacterium TaxID=2212470 RepID=A0A933W320_UNCEI|nr:T9SS type A sorting domain-containing protein [Candidatus Eisenbacteria bacterium]